jgi:hypothetical protein
MSGAIHLLPQYAFMGWCLVTSCVLKSVVYSSFALFNERWQNNYEFREFMHRTGSLMLQYCLDVSLVQLRNTTKIAVLSAQVLSEYLSSTVYFTAVLIFMLFG